MFLMAVDYLVLITWGFSGVLQIVASHSSLYGLRLFSDRWKGYLTGIIIFVSAFLWFFGTGNRTIEGHLTGVQGTEQVGLILAGVAVSIFITALSVSILHLKTKPKPSETGYSLEQIRSSTYLQAFLHHMKRKN
jgi:hypothetical protein